MLRRSSTTWLACIAVVSLGACRMGQKAAPAPEPTAAETADQAPSGVLRLGAPIDAKTESVSLGDVAHEPESWVGKSFTTAGTVTAVCQHMGCWMELRDDAGEAHIKMAGHAFFVPKTASGRRARVQATLVKAEPAGNACEGEGHGKGEGCRAEAEKQLGRPLAKLSLVAEGVELM
jgi:hypothetical protein